VNPADLQTLAARIAIPVPHLQFLLAQLKLYIPSVTVWAFGSRVKGSHHPASDLDLAVLCDKETAQKILPKLNDVLVESDLPFKVQLLDFNRLLPNMQENIKNKFVVLSQAREKTDEIMNYEKEIALYYPHIDINDVTLIKTAALYWDEIQTIVPEDEIDKGHKIYNTAISIEAEKEHFLKSRIVTPIDEVLRQVGTEIIDDLERTPQILDSIRKVIRTSIRPQERKRPKFSRIHIEKFNPLELLRLKNILDKSSITISSYDNACDWIIVPTPFYDMYMSRLASVIADKDSTSPLTNETLWQDVVIGRALDYSMERRQNQSELAKLSLQTIAVNPGVPLIDILRFREKHQKDLIKYRTHIRKLVHEISKGLNTSEKQTLFEEMIKDEFLPAKEEIEAKLSNNADWFMINNVAILIGGIGEILLSGGQAWLASLFKGTIRAGINILGTIRDDRKCIKNHPVGYLYQAQKKFGANE